MLKINRVDTVGGDMLELELSNGSIILLSLDTLLEDARFSGLEEDDLVFHPKTDGERVFWREGQSLTIEEAGRMAFSLDRRQNDR